jgi:hypothetical protein
MGDDAAAGIQILPDEGKPPPLPVDRLHGLGVVVRDARRAAEEFSDVFGIQSWGIHRLKTGDDFTIKSAGVTVDAELIIATGGTHNLKFDLIQPVSGETIFQEFLTRGGPGVHDLTTHVMTPADFSALAPRLTHEGIGVLQSLQVRGRFDIHYLDTAGQLATIVKIVVPQPDQRVFDASDADQLVRVDVAPATRRLPIDKPYHVCVVTHHRRLSVQESFRRLFGIERWFELDSQTGVNATDPHHRKRLGDWRFRTVSGRRDAFCIEIVETMRGRNGYQDMLDTRGEGIHHVMTTICGLDRFQAAERELESAGYARIQDGITGPIFYAYLASEEKLAGLAVEVVCPLSDDWKASQSDDLWYILMGPQY